MFGFGKRKPDYIVNPGDAAAALSPPGTYQLSWERQRMPDPGAQAFSWETLELPIMNLVNSGFGGTRNWQVVAVPLWVGQAVPITGLPRVAAQIAFQPLIRTG